MRSWRSWPRVDFRVRDIDAPNIASELAKWPVWFTMSVHGFSRVFTIHENPELVEYLKQLGGCTDFRHYEVK